MVCPSTCWKKQDVINGERCVKQLKYKETKPTTAFDIVQSQLSVKLMSPSFLLSCRAQLFAYNLHPHAGAYTGGDKCIFYQLL